MPFTSFTRRDASSFSIFSDSMMQNESLPLTEVMGEKCFQEGFDDHGIDFGDDEETVYTPAIVLWALVSQVLFKGEQRSCAAAVSRIASWWASQGRLIDDTSTGAYCRARAKIPFEVLRQITRRLAEQSESAVDLDDGLTEEQAEDRRTPSIVNEVRQKPVRGRVLLVDGFTVDAADTPENQAEFPQNPSQQEGLGFPILRCVSLISMGEKKVSGLFSRGEKGVRGEKGEKGRKRGEGEKKVSGLFSRPSPRSEG